MLNTSAYSIFNLVGVPEWLSDITRNHVGFGRAGLNLAAHDLFCTKTFFTSGYRAQLEISNPTTQNFDLLCVSLIGRAGVVIRHD